MSVLVGRDGNISLLRLGTLGGIIGIVAVVGGILSFVLDRNSRMAPYSVPVFPNAQQLAGYPLALSETSQRIVYSVGGTTAEDVAAYYQQKLSEFSGNTERCVRNPASGNFAEFDQGVADVPPFQISCLFDNSGFNSMQITRINVQPGVASQQTEGMVLIEYIQEWQR